MDIKVEAKDSDGWLQMKEHEAKIKSLVQTPYLADFKSKKIFRSVVPQLQEKMINLLSLCEKEGISLRLTSGLRTLDEQNKLYRQSHSGQAVQATIRKLRALKADYLAAAIERVGTQKTGPKVTNAYGGVSWHNWGHAMDVAIFDEDGAMIHDGAHPLVQKYGSLAQQVGLKWGGDFKDYLHVQLSKYEVPAVYNLKEINDHFM